MCHITDFNYKIFATLVSLQIRLYEQRNPNNFEKMIFSTPLNLDPFIPIPFIHI